MLKKTSQFFTAILILLSLWFLFPNNVKAENYCNCTIKEINSGCVVSTYCTTHAGKCGTSCTPSKKSTSKSSPANTSAYLGGTIPNCTDLSKNGCDDVSVFLVSAIGVGQYVFGIIGVIALVMFVYGGLVWITANGNPEKVKQGMGIFLSAVIGLVIVFSAYMLVKYFGSSILNITSEYQLK